jgi:hypothetical protein
MGLRAKAEATVRRLGDLEDLCWSDVFGGG